MKERQSELTRQPVNPTLGGGDIFMAEPGQGEQPPREPQERAPRASRTGETGRVEDTVRHLARIRVEGERAAPLGPDGLPVGFGSWPTEVRKAWIDRQRDSAGEQLLSQQLVVREDPHAISPAQQESLDRIYPLIDENPEAMAESYVRAIDTLSERRGEPIVHKDLDYLFERALQSVHGRISERSERRFRKELGVIKTKTFAEATRGFKKLVTKVVKEPEAEPKRKEAAERRRAARQEAVQPPAQPPVDETPAPEPAVPPAGAPPETPPPASPAGPAPEGERPAEEVRPAPLSEPRRERRLPQDEEERLKRLAEYAAQRAELLQERTAFIREYISDPEWRKSWAEAGRTPPSADDLLRQFDFSRLERQIAEREPIIIPHSLEDLARLVMSTAAPEYRAGDGTGKRGEKALIEIDENGNERVNTLHFLEWARDNYIKVHLNNPTAPVNFFSDIATNVRSEGYGAIISFYEMTFTEGYFLREEKKADGSVGYVEDADYRALQSQMLMEVFLLQLQRNPAITYMVQTRAEREKMLNTLAEAFATNPITRNDFFERVFTMPSMRTTTDYESNPIHRGRELQAKLEGNFDMGTAIREALSVYMNITNYRQLVEILGPDAPLFRDEYQTHSQWTAKLEDVSHSGNREWFNEDGSLKLYKNGLPHPDFMKHINIFRGPSLPQVQLNEIRERIRFSIMKSNGISYREAQIAELFAFSMAHINGVAARGDVDSVGFDWWTRITNFLDKRKREKSPKRNAPYGSKFNMEGFRRIGLNVMETVRDTKGRSLRQIIQGTGKDRYIDIKGTPLKRNTADYERDYDTDDEGYVRLVDAGDPTRDVTEEKGIKRFVKRIEGEDRLVFIDGNGLTVDVSTLEGARATANYIVLRDSDKNIVNLDTRPESPELVDGRIVFKDRAGAEVDIGDLTPKIKVARTDKPVEFNQDIQKQFLPNHIITGSEIYEWIMRKKELNLPELVKDWDAHGNPILDWEKINEIKGVIEHHFRYAFSTWGEINFGEINVEWERVEERNEKRRLIDEHGNELDEDWYILKNGKRTDQRADPKTYIRSREMTRLENMFGAPALKYIQFEIERRNLEREGDEYIHVEDPRTGEVVKVNISAARDNERRSEYRTAVWQGAFDYLIGAEIEAHRTRGSGDRYYNFFDMLKVKQALEMGQILEPKQIGQISKQTDTTDTKLFSQELGFAATTGATEGVLKSLRKFFASAISGT